MPRRLIQAIAAVVLLLAPGSGIASTVLAGGGCHADVSGSVHTDGTASVIRMDVCSFAPTVARVPVGTEVRFLNTSTVEHVVLGRGQTWGGAPLPPGRELIQAFAEPGVFPYSCPLHPGMVGAVVVGDAGEGAATVADLVGPTPVPDRPAAGVDASSSTDGVGVVALAAGGGGLMLGMLLAAVARGRGRRAASS